MGTFIITYILGLVAGVIFFGGLWITVRKLPSTSYPALWALVSFSIRLLMVVIGFYLVVGNSWEKALWMLLGFITIRMVSIYLVKIRNKEIAKG